MRDDGCVSWGDLGPNDAVVVMPVMPDATTNPPWTMQATSPLTRCESGGVGVSDHPKLIGTAAFSRSRFVSQKVSVHAIIVWTLAYMTVQIERQTLRRYWDTCWLPSLD